MRTFDRAGEALLLRFQGQRQLMAGLSGLLRRLLVSLRRADVPPPDSLP